MMTKDLQEIIDQTLAIAEEKAALIENEKAQQAYDKGYADAMTRSVVYQQHVHLTLQDPGKTDHIEISQQSANKLPEIAKNVRDGIAELTMLSSYYKGALVGNSERLLRETTLMCLQNNRPAIQRAVSIGIAGLSLADSIYTEKTAEVIAEIVTKEPSIAGMIRQELKKYA
ncbi:TPA: hypothetical protein HA265_07305 [Candidatus Woesearchaeota archaeon]|nr:hypothetical protein [Candidatus Woesearchaeota archaeon]